MALLPGKPSSHFWEACPPKKAGGYGWAREGGLLWPDGWVTLRSGGCIHSLGFLVAGGIRVRGQEEFVLKRGV